MFSGITLKLYTWKSSQPFLKNVFNVYSGFLGEHSNLRALLLVYDRSVLRAKLYSIVDNTTRGYVSRMIRSV